jgi:DNA replicative helicase MCM subunit Mcm2 (Cdc46/Mcm family)
MNSIIQEDIKKEFTRFLQLFEINEKNKEKEPKYLAQIKRLFDTHRHLLIIEYQDLISFNSDFANLLFEDYYKY